MERFEELKKLISVATDHVEFSEYGDGISEDWIIKAETRLGFSLPESYKWWLRSYSGGEIHGEEIYSIFEIELNNIREGDIVYMHELYQKKQKYQSNNLVVSESKDDVFYFDLSKKSGENEYPIYAMSSRQEYAKDFIEFLEKRITSGVWNH
jgi:hypothetical protein